MNLDVYRSNLQSEHFSYSQCLQDVFALMINDYKFNGTCLDIGCATPSTMYSNSKLLLLHNWKCIGADVGDYYDNWLGYDNFEFNSLNCTNQESIDLLFDKFEHDVIDFLSLDIDDETADSLELINFDKFKIKCICIEHNKYLGSRGDQRHRQRKILKDAGYIMIVKNWHNFEDWWIHPDFIDFEKFKYLQIFNNQMFNENLDLNTFCPDHRKHIINNKNQFNINILNKLKH